MKVQSSSCQLFCFPGQSSPPNRNAHTWSNGLDECFAMERHLLVSKAWKVRSGEMASCDALKNALERSSRGSSTRGSSSVKGSSSSLDSSSAMDSSFLAVVTFFGSRASSAIACGPGTGSWKLRRLLRGERDLGLSSTGSDFCDLDMCSMTFASFSTVAVNSFSF